MDKIPEVEEFDFPFAAQIDEAEYVVGSKTAPPLLGIKIEIDGIQPIVADIDDGGADQSLAHPVLQLGAVDDGI